MNNPQGFPTPGQVFGQAVQRFQAGDMAGAESFCLECQRQWPNFPDAWHMHGLICAQSSRLDQAYASMTEARKYAPQDINLMVNYGELLRRMARYNEAIPILQTVTKAQPKFAQAWQNLGIAFYNVGRLDDSAVALANACNLAPNNPVFLFSLANTQADRGLSREALRIYADAVKLKPDYADAWLNYGNTLLALDMYSEALAAYENVHRYNPEKIAVLESIAQMKVRLGYPNEAKPLLAKASQARKSPWLWELRQSALDPLIFANDQAVVDYRSELIQTLDRLIARKPELKDADELLAAAVEPPMCLTYQEADEHQIKERYRTLFSSIWPATEPARHDGPPHVGIFVTHGHEGVFMKCMQGIVERLGQRKTQTKYTLIAGSPAGFNIFKSHMKLGNVGLATVARDHMDKCNTVLRELKLSVIHYWENGTDAMNFFLPYYQAAPVQVGSWGWPSSSWNPHIQWHFTWSQLHTPQVDARYSEKLFAPDVIPVCYAKPPQAPTTDREKLGLPPGRLYMCVQNLRKYQPRFDRVIAQILEQDPEGRVALLGDTHEHITQMLRMRLASAGAKMDRVTFMPRSDYPTLIGRLASADVVLDTTGYGAGANTALDTIYSTTPVVTFPEFDQRNRWTAAVLQQAGVTQGAVQSLDQYAPTAVRFARDKDLNQALRSQALAGCSAVIERPEVVDVLDEWWTRLASV